jgi:ArsR family transcriptional regulator
LTKLDEVPTLSSVGANTAKNELPAGDVACCAPVRVLARAARTARPFARLFKALGDETRLAMLALLAAAGRELCVCEIEKRVDLSQPTVSHHLKILREAGLVTAERRGTWVYYGLSRHTLARLGEFRALLGG